jgi:hypothetical protein
MRNTKNLKCYHCNSVIIDLPESEIIKLNGLNFRCECCNNENLLSGLKFRKSCNSDPYNNILSIENIWQLYPDAI